MGTNMPLFGIGRKAGQSALFKRMDMLAHQEKSLFNSSVRASFPARLADAVVSK